MNDQSEGYDQFIESRRQLGGSHGFDPVWSPDFLYPFQQMLVEWSIRMGRSAIFADCGLGKTPMQLVFAENIARKTNRRVLIATPLAVASQTIREAEKFGIEVKMSRDGKSCSKIVATNYEQLHKFDPSDFVGMVCDESSILKNYDGKTKAIVNEFMRKLPYRLLCTATAAPNDYMELGTSSEALGYLGYQDMLTRFFVQDLDKKGHKGWGRQKYRFRSHAIEWFWRWVCSWARVIRKPSDYGFDDDGFELPELKVDQHVVHASRPRDGMLFALPASNHREELEERRLTLTERCEKAAEIVADSSSAVSWCHLNQEGDLLEELIPGAVQVSGADSDERKEEVLEAFSRGEVTHLVTKPKIAGFGLNWQHCSHTTTFPSHSYEQYYQLVRRFLRFGQQAPFVKVDVITTDGEESVLRNLQKKSRKADEMFSSLLANTSNALSVNGSNGHAVKQEMPAWLTTKC